MAWVLILCGLAGASGCQKVGDFFKTDVRRFLSPDKVIDAPDRAPIIPIRQSFGVVDAQQEMVPNATLPTLADLSYSDRDYIIGPTDVLDISILDLFSEGVETVLRRQVSTSGYVDLPLLKNRVQADGMTAEQFKEKIRKAYQAGLILRDPTVAITIIAQRRSVFSVLGAVARPGSYNIIRKDMRLMEALALAGDVTQANIRYIYVIRPAPAVRRTQLRLKTDEPIVPGELPPLPTLPTPSPTAPDSAPATTRSTNVSDVIKEFGTVIEGPSPATQPLTQPSPAPAPSALLRLSETGNVPVASLPATADDPDLKKATDKAYKWVYTNGRWIRVAQEAPVASKPSGKGAPRVHPSGYKPPEPKTTTAEAQEADPFGWQKQGDVGLARIIAINLNKLNQGNSRMNIVVRDNDIIQVPTLEVGEFYVMGEVLRPGVYSLTGRRVTVKMALAAAGNLAPLAWPENSILIRRVEGDKEQIIGIDIEAIFDGKENDIYLRPNDVLAIGTDVRAQFYAVLRNAFRMTYGFGFIYDRNFADPLENGGRGYTSERFRKW